MVVYTPGLVVTTSLYADPVVPPLVACDGIGHAIVLDSVEISTLSSCNRAVTAPRRRT
jgi:hypothetical protein